MKRWLFYLSAACVLTAIAVAAWFTRETWMSLARGPAAVQPEESGHDDHTGHDHHAGHDHHEPEGILELSEQARANLDLRLGTLTLSDYTVSLVLPGVVVEQPGHSERHITTTLSGVVTRVHAFPGQTIRPGDAVLDMQPTGEVLNTAQSSLLKTIQDLELLDLELKRIAPLVENNTIPARTKIEKEYERKRLESLKLVQIQELLVRGLTAEQITEVVEHKTLLREFTIFVPGAPPKTVPRDEDHSHPSIVPTSLRSPTAPLATADNDVAYSVERINIFPGKLIQPGDDLCELAYHTSLYLEGHAFERDVTIVLGAMERQWPVTALFEEGTTGLVERTGLQIRYIDNALDATSRTLRFYLPLKNEVLRDTVGDNGLVYRSWRFKPGQKVRIVLPIRQLEQQIVLPADAVTAEGPDAYVFRARGRKLERVPVVIEHRDPRHVVIRKDGSIAPGAKVALNQAYQLLLALKRLDGGSTPHAHEH